MSRCYQFPTGWSLGAAVERLMELCRTEPEALESEHVGYYDSFDGRLFREGLCLRLTEELPGTARLERLDGRLLADQPLARRPPRATDLPPGDLRRQLEPVLELRAPLPRLRLANEIRPLRLLNKDCKIVARLHLCHCHIDGHPGAEMGLRLDVAPLKGYDGETGKLLASAVAAIPLLPAPPLYPEGCRLAGIPPEGIGSRPQVPLTPTLPAGEACRLLLLALLTVMEANRPGVEADTDTEFLHDFRVALRRTRALLREAKASLDPARLAPFLAGFRWLGERTGGLRDLDVLLQQLPELAAGLPDEIQADLDPLLRLLAEERRRALQQLRRSLRRERFHQLMQDWRQALTDDSLLLADSPTFARLLRKRLRRALRRLLERGAILPTEGGETELHRLRIAGKRLRYLLEFAEPLLPARKVHPPLQALKHLQDVLGAHQDAVVQVAHLRRLQDRMTAAGTMTPATADAICCLQEMLAQRQSQWRDASCAAIAAFAGNNNLSHWQRLLKRLRREE